MSRRLVSAKVLFSRETEDNDVIEDQRVFARKRNQFLVNVFARINQNDCLDDLRARLSPLFPSARFTDSLHVTLINGFYCIPYHLVRALNHCLICRLKTIEEFVLCLSETSVFESEKRAFLVFKQKTTEKTPQVVRQVMEEFARHSIVAEIPIEEFSVHVSFASFPKEEKRKAEEMLERVRDCEEWEPIVVRVKELEVEIGGKDSKVILLS